MGTVHTWTFHSHDRHFVGGFPARNVSCQIETEKKSTRRRRRRRRSRCCPSGQYSSPRRTYSVTTTTTVKNHGHNHHPPNPRIHKINHLHLEKSKHNPSPLHVPNHQSKPPINNPITPILIQKIPLDNRPRQLPPFTPRLRQSGQLPRLHAHHVRRLHHPSPHGTHAKRPTHVPNQRPAHHPRLPPHFRSPSSSLLYSRLGTVVARFGLCCYNAQSSYVPCPRRSGQYVIFGSCCRAVRRCAAGGSHVRPSVSVGVKVG